MSACHNGVVLTHPQASSLALDSVTMTHCCAAPAVLNLRNCAPPLRAKIECCLVGLCRVRQEADEDVHEEAKTVQPA
jgi:hypothetical protein